MDKNIPENSHFLLLLMVRFVIYTIFQNTIFHRNYGVNNGGARSVNNGGARGVNNGGARGVMVIVVGNGHEFES